MPAERAVDHLPLHRVGVLELVDHHDRPALAHPVPGGGVVGLQRGGQPDQQVVVAQDAQPTLARLKLGDNGLSRSRPAQPPRVPGVRVLRAAAPCTGCRRPRGPARSASRVGQRRVVALLAEMREVEIVDDLGDQLVEALDQRDPGVGVAGHAQRFQHQLAELVRGRDRRRVEPGQRVAQPLPPLGALVVGAGEQMLDHLVVADQWTGRRKRASASTIWPRTRSRSSWLAARPNVMSSIWSSVAAPSAT